MAAFIVWDTVSGHIDSLAEGLDTLPEFANCSGETQQNAKAIADQFDQWKIQVWGDAADPECKATLHCEVTCTTDKVEFHFQSSMDDEMDEDDLADPVVVEGSRIYFRNPELGWESDIEDPDEDPTKPYHTPRQVAYDTLKILEFCSSPGYKGGQP